MRSRDRDRYANRAARWGEDPGIRYRRPSGPPALPPSRRGRTRRRVLGGSLGAVALLGAAAAVGAALAYRRLRRGEPLPTFVAGDRDSEGIRVRQAITVDRSAGELYEHWRVLSNLPAIMRHLEEVEDRGAGRSHWRARGPLDTAFAWDATLVADRPGERIAWRSDEDATVPNEGSVEFRAAPGERGTELRVQLTYHPPFGAAGAALARLFGEEPNQQVAEDLRRFKQRMETGAAATTRGQPRGAS